MQVRLLSGGAAQGLVGAIASRFREETGGTIAGTFGAVGAMRDLLISGEPADLLILTSALVADLTQQGHIVADSVADVGRVRTGIAVPSGQPLPAIGTPEELRSALLAAEAIYYPDPQRATAGIHFAKVLDNLGISGAALDRRARTYPNGATAMRALADAAGEGGIGCTQVTEILATEGLAVAGPLPRPFELTTTYTAGVCARAAAAGPARALCGLLTGADALSARKAAGFDSLS